MTNPQQDAVLNELAGHGVLTWRPGPSGDGVVLRLLPMSREECVRVFHALSPAAQGVWEIISRTLLHAKAQMQAEAN